MKNNVIKYKKDQVEILSPVCYCTFYSDCVLIQDQIDEFQTVIVPNGEWEYVEEEIVIPNYTYHQHLDYGRYCSQYRSELAKLRREWWNKINPQNLPNYNHIIAEKFNNYVLESYGIKYAFSILTDIVKNNEPLPEWAITYKNFPISKVKNEIDLGIRWSNYWEEFRKKSQIEFPDECLSIESWLEKLNI